MIAVHLITLWHSLKWDVVESEWESTSTFSGIDSLKLAWCLLSLYFTASAVLCAIGFIGSVKRRPAYVRMYRDYWVTDISLSSLATIIFGTASFNPTVRTSICEEISRQPQLTRELVEVGLDLENCEPWLERAVVVGAGIMIIILIVRLQFLVALTRLYRYLIHTTKGWRSLEDGPGHNAIACQRIFVLPQRAESANTDDMIVYAPVPLSSLSSEETRGLQETEVWLSHKGFRKHSRAAHRRSSTSQPSNQSAL